jgi:hypothetical protein
LLSALQQPIRILGNLPLPCLLAISGVKHESELDRLVAEWQKAGKATRLSIHERLQLADEGGCVSLGVGLVPKD